MSEGEKEEAVAEALIRQRVEDYAKAISAKDIDSVMSFLHPTSDATRTATPPSAAFPSSSSSGLWPPATTSASSSTRAPSTWRPFGSGYEIRSHDPRDTL